MTAGDITERLRVASGFALMSAARNTLREAADEIDRLRAELDKASNVMNDCIREHGEMRMMCANGRYLTDAEHAAIGLAIAVMNGRGCGTTAQTLERLAGRLDESTVTGGRK
jgi:hypothetical protein